MVSDAETESIFMEPIHLSSAVAAKQIINEGNAIRRWLGAGRGPRSSGDPWEGPMGRAKGASPVVPIALRGADPKKPIPPTQLIINLPEPEGERIRYQCE